MGKIIFHEFLCYSQNKDNFVIPYRSIPNNYKQCFYDFTPSFSIDMRLCMGYQRIEYFDFLDISYAKKKLKNNLEMPLLVVFRNASKIPKLSLFNCVIKTHALVFS